MAWRLAEKCDNCPFAKSGPGLHLKQSLGLQRWRGILFDLRHNRHFVCHKTTKETGNGTNLVCAGSIEWSEKRGVSQNFCRVMECVFAIYHRKDAAKN
jgi:hypothetical protein